ncbi:hypothetical protein [Phycisphaera mikurensis]|uniref:Uncharacterized protein n=1 Tax=Phycisphaera mikurensis (strain NBRC 102666 / KCTC 22515 / FYK2301M01) TaxID=1142394 RepID=I0IFD2_PHYMF|nr:hypothetical protein [Phycisphaera mikurensis]MBB6440637.1 hypothetical protein [Phycisphaera mikurensis]BAM03970.1 hypothetical protein PSMK_18110 [Phycisphaera mikurensis NBRC 102666]
MTPPEAAKPRDGAGRGRVGASSRLGATRPAALLSLLLATAGCVGGPPPRTAAVPGPEASRSADPPRSAGAGAVLRSVLDDAAIGKLVGGFRTVCGTRGEAIREVVEVAAGGEALLLHTLLLSDPPVAARWFGEAWTPSPQRVRRVASDGLVDEVAAEAGAAWRVRLTGPAGFPLGDFAGAWTHGTKGPSFTGRSAGGLRLPPVPGGGGGGWLPSATLRVEPAAGRWWIEDDAGERAWSKTSLKADVGPLPPGQPAFWSAVGERIDRRLAAGPLRVSAEPWSAAFAAAERVARGAVGAEEAAEELLATVAPGR